MSDIIINADDFGFSENTVEATIKLFELKAISSATIMLSMPGTEFAIDYAKKNPQFSFGLHLNLITDDVEKPILQSLDIPTLTTKDGFFHSITKLRLLSLMNLIDKEDIILETVAQINCIKNKDINISHIDSHGHTHKLPLISKALSKIEGKNKIKKIRNTQNIFLNKKYNSPTFWLQHIYKKNIVKNFKTTNYFYMDSYHQDMNWPEIISKLKLNGSIEIGVHPGSDLEWKIKETENTILFSDKIKKDSNFNIINWDSL